MRVSIRRGPAAVPLALAGAVAVAATAGMGRADEPGDLPWAVRQSGFEVVLVAEDLQLPVNIAFVPVPGSDPCDPLFYVTELYGTIKVVTRNYEIGDYATDLLNFEPTGSFPGSGEQGVTGVAVDPENGDVYATMLYEFDGDPARHYPKVVRFTSKDGGLTAATRETVLDLFGELQGQAHQISTIEFAPDGTLFVHMGDGFRSERARDLTSFRGKILRLSRDGSPPKDNPFYDPEDGIDATDYVWALGVRNPFGGARRAADGFRYLVENGPHVDRFAKIVPGRDYTWDGDNDDMRAFAIYNWSPAHAPVNIAFVQPETFDGSGFPVTKMDHAFVSESSDTWGSGPREKAITEFVLDAEGNLVSGPTPLIEYVGTGKATVVALAAGPDGLYFSDFYKDHDYEAPADRGARILRVQVTCPADVDASGGVDFDDLLLLLAAWGDAGGPLDLDRSGTVDFGDLLRVLDAWGPCP